MTVQEKQKFIEMEKNIEQIMEVQTSNGKKLDEVLDALKGNGLGEKGIVKRLEDVEKEIQNFKTSGTRNSVYMKIFIWMAGIIMALIIAYMFNAALQKPQQQLQPIQMSK